MKVSVLSHEQVRERAAAAAAEASDAEESTSEPEVVASEAAPVALVEDASPEAATEVAPPVVEEVTPVAVPDVEAVAEPSGVETGPSDKSEGEVQSDARVSVALPVETFAVQGSDLVTESKH